jgi:hypothetical protein
VKPVEMHQHDALMEGNIMAALIKRIFKNKHSKHPTTWANREEREQFELQREQWKERAVEFMFL